MRPVLLLAALALAGCATPNYYLTPAPAASARATSSIGGIVVADISLPAYAEAIEIAVLDPASGAVTLEPDALWADTPRRALTRHLVASLQERLPAQIASEPWPSFDSPSYRIEVAVDRMIGAPDGPFAFSGQYVIVSPISGSIVSTERFALTVPAGPGYQGLIDAHARAVEALADRIAARLSRGGLS